MAGLVDADRFDISEYDDQVKEQKRLREKQLFSRMQALSQAIEAVAKTACVCICFR